MSPRSKKQKTSHHTSSSSSHTENGTMTAQAKAAPPPAGVYVPVPTFFVGKSDKSYTAVSTPLDSVTQAKHSIHLARSGVTGLVVLGSTGEAVHLTTKERNEVLKGVKKAFDDEKITNAHIIAGTASQNIEEVLEQLQGAKEAGSGWGLVLAPGYFAGASSQEGLITWFTAVADRSPIPILIYYYPGVSNNVKVAPSTFAILSQHPNIVGCKLSHGDVSHHAQIASNPAIDHSHFHTFTGLGQQLLPVLSVGAAGTIDGTAGFFPKSVVRLYELGTKEAPTKKEVAEARLLQYKVSSVEEIVVKYGTVGIKECVSRILGLGDKEGTRVPLVGGIPGGDKEWENWKQAIGDLDAVEKSLP